jgi:hypothetical protein
VYKVLEKNSEGSV